ncbi:MAG TPA: TrmH family RNA methyltransferase [Terracidiphilus sp.]|nr:TrmH family RNA methyltransferase [Terracidiphilus sp.]
MVLVHPRNPLNIGAAARAMANFGFTKLSVVAPFEPHWREARSAVGASGLLQSAKSTECLAEAVSNCAFVVGTAALARRKPGQTVLRLPQLAPVVAGKLEGDSRAALVFGPEKHGLTRDDLSYCHVLVEIPTEPHQPSMNLGQAVAVCLYELARSGDASNTGAQPSLDSAPDAASGSLDLLAGVIEETMIASGYSPAAMRAANAQDLRLMLRRLSIDESDAHRALRLFRRILWRIRRP